MRNMKRVLSLVLAMVMLLGMLTIPTGAASNFTDADQIVNKDAVNIISGLKIMEGVGDNTFNPQGTVTRAQMATIIVKMMYGSDFNADTFKGAGNPFPDTAGFEGGWAEGYINACFQMGVVKGYGDGTFKPGNQVTTAEAVTMIINALKVDAGEGEWPNTVMAKATEMELFGDLKPAPATNDVLVRDQLAVITLKGLEHSPSGKSGYTVQGIDDVVFKDMADALTAAMEMYDDDLNDKIDPAWGDDSLAVSVYGMDTVTDFITDNQATGFDYTMVDGEEFDVETGLDMIGHWVTVYYQVPKSGESVDAYKVYAVVDESQVFTAGEDITNSKDYKALFGKNYDSADSVLVFEGDYTSDEAASISGYTKGSAAKAGTYIVNENKIVAYLKPATKYASYISSVSEFDGEKTYMLGGMFTTIAEEDITLYAGASKGDVVTYVKAKDQYVLEPVDPVKGTITKTGKNTEGKDVLTLNGQEYVAFGAANNATAGADLTIAVDTATFEYGEQYTVYLTQDNKVVGWMLTEGGVAGEVDVNKIVYAVGAFQKTSKDSYGAKTIQHVLQAVNAQGEEVHYLLAEERLASGVTLDGNFDWINGHSAYEEGFYVVEDYVGSDSEAKKAGIKTVTRVGLQSEDTTGLDLFYGTNRWASGTTIPASYSNNHICSTDCTGWAGGKDFHSYSDTAEKDLNTRRTYFSDATKFLMIDGVKGEQLNCAAGGEDFKYSYEGSSTFGLPMLYTEDDNGLVDVVMVVILKDPNDLTANNPPIYVSSSKPMGTAPGGDLYQAYLAQTAEPIEIVVRTGTTVTAGFKSYTVDEDGRYTLSDSTHDNAYQGMVLTGITSAGVLNAYDPNYDTSSTTKMDTPAGTAAKSAKIVDLRSDDNIKESGVGTITDLEQLRTLIDNKYVVNFDSWSATGSSPKTHAIYITSTYKTAAEDVVVYVTAPAGKAGNATTAYSTMDGNKTVIALTMDSDVEGFATMVFTNEKKYLAPNTGDEYCVEAIVESMTKSGDNVVVATDKGSFTVTAATVIAKTGEGITTPAQLKAAYDEDAGTYVVSAVVVDGKATFFIITDKGDTNISDGDMIKVTTKLAATTTGSTTPAEMYLGKRVATGTDLGTIEYASVTYPDGSDMVETGEYYYTVSKNVEGKVALTFCANYVAQENDALYIPGAVTAGDVVDAYALSGRGDVPADELVRAYIPEDALGRKKDANYSAKIADGTTRLTSDRFWHMTGNVLGAVQGVWGTPKLTYTYHDAVAGWDGSTLTTVDAPGHIRVPNGVDEEGSTVYKAVCAYDFTPYACNHDTGERKNEASTTLTVDDVTIIDLTGSVTGSTVNEKMNSIWELTDAENAVLNIYVNGVTTGEGTEYFAKVIIVLPPEAGFVAKGMMTVPAPDHGTVVLNKMNANVGDSIKVTATADHGYELTAIKVDGKAIDGNFFTVKGNHTVTAEFTELEHYDVTVTYNDETLGSATVTSLMDGETEDKFYGGDLVTIATDPAPNYWASEITVNGEPVEIVNGTATFTITGAAQIVVNFEVDPSDYEVTGGEYVTVTGEVIGKTGQNVTVTVAVDPPDGYGVSGYKMNGKDITVNLDGTATVTIENTGDNKIIAEIGKLYYVTEGDCEFGSVSVDKAEGYLEGNTVTVTATAEAGFKPYQIVVTTEGEDDDTVLTPDTDGKATFTATVAKQTVTATFVYDLQAGDAVYPLEVLNADSVKRVLIANSDTVEAGTMVKIIAPNGNGSKYTALRMGRVNSSDGKITLYQDTGTQQKDLDGDGKKEKIPGGYMDGMMYKVGVHEALIKVDTEKKTFEMGAFEADIHTKRDTCLWNSKAGYGSSNLGYHMNYTSNGCETVAHECVATQKYDGNTAFVELVNFKSSNTFVEFQKLTAEEFAARAGRQDVMIDVYVPDGESGASGTASLVVIAPVDPNK